MRGRRRRDIIIELTSLLDVIMIIIFMVMKENSRMILDKQNAVDNAQQINASQSVMIDELTAEKDELSQKVEELTGKLEEAQGKLDEGSVEELLEQLQAAQNKLDSYKALDDIVIVLNIGVENKWGNTVRVMTFGKTSQASTVIESRSDEEFEVSLNKMKVFVTDYITKVLDDKDNQTIVYVVFTYDPTKVYQRDYEAVGNALAEAESKANNGNFRYRINPLIR